MYENRRKYSYEDTITYNCNKYGVFNKEKIKEIIDRLNNRPKIILTETQKLPISLFTSIMFASRLEIDQCFQNISNKEIVEDKYSGVPQEPFIKSYGKWIFKDEEYFRKKLRKLFETKNNRKEFIDDDDFDFDVDFIIHNYDYKYRFILKKISFYEWITRYQLPKESNKGFEFEVAVAHYFQYKKIKCNNCGLANIQLAGGFGNPYVDMKCKCGALFEIKSKKQDIINLIIDRKRRLYGGSFRHFKELEKHRKVSNLPHYIVLVGSDSGNIYISNITKINIKLCKESLVCSIPQIKSIINFDNFYLIGNFDINIIPSCKEEESYYLNKKKYIFEKLKEYIVLIQKHIRGFLCRRKKKE